MENQVLKKSGIIAVIATFAVLVAWFGFSKISPGAYNEKNLTMQFLGEDSEVFKTIVIEVGSDTVARIVAGTSSMTRTGTSSYPGQPRIEYNGATGQWSFKNIGGTTTTAFGTVTADYVAAQIGSTTANYVLQNSGSSTNQTATNATLAGSTTIGTVSTITAGGAPFAGTKVGYLSDVTDFIQAQINNKQANLGYSPLSNDIGSVTIALGSQSVNALNDMNVVMNEGDFLKISGGQIVAGSSSSSVAFSAVLGSSTDNTNFSTTPGFSKVPVTGPTSSSLVSWISGSLTVQSVVATATVTIGTVTPINNSIVTIYGTNAPILNISYGQGVQGIISAKMTSDTAPSPNVTSASTTFGGDNAAWKALDRVAGTSWLTQNTITTGWLKYDFGAGYARILSSYIISVESNQLPGNAPKNFSLLGSNNDSSWTTLDTQINILGWVGSVDKVFYLKPYSTAYRYYKLDITAINGGSYVAVSELGLYNAGFSTVMSISENGIVSLGTTTVKSTDTSFLLQIEGNGIANQWGVACFEAIKSVIGSGSDIIKQGFDAVMQTPIFTHHPKKSVSYEEAEKGAIDEYAYNFIIEDFNTFKTDNILKYTTANSEGSATVNFDLMKRDFEVLYINPRRDEFYLLNDLEKRIENKKQELSTDKTVINITPISDNPLTSPLFRLNNSDYLSVENQIGALMATTQYQQAEIGSLMAALENQKVVYNEEVDNLYNWINTLIAAIVALGGGGWATIRRKRKGT